MKPSLWLTSASLSLLIPFLAWSQNAPETPVSEEEANAAALELANSLDFENEEKPLAEPETQDTPPEPRPEEPANSEGNPTSLLKPGNLSKPYNQPGMPLTITESDFKSLQSNSPFTRSLNLSDSLILTGIAKIGEETIATLVDKKTKESYVVSANANAQGWRMIEVAGDQSDLEKMTAKISVAGGEVISVRFDENQLKPGEGKPAAGSSSGERREEGRGDGRRGGPSTEFREKMSQLTEEQRGKLFDKMRQIREANPDLTREQMGEKFMGMADQLIKKNQK